MSINHLIYSPYLLQLSDMDVLRQALTWKFPPLWQIIGTQKFKINDVLKKNIKIWIMDVLNSAKARLGENLIYSTRINIIVIGEREHKILEPFMLYTAETEDQIEAMLENFLEKYGNEDYTDEIKVYIIGKIGKILIKQPNKEGKNKITWIKESKIQGLKQQLLDKDIVYAKYKNGAIIQIDKQKQNQYAVKLLKEREKENIKWNTNWNEEPTICNEPKDYTVEARYMEEELKDRIVRTSRDIILKYDKEGNYISRKDYIYTRPLLEEIRIENKKNKNYATLDIETYRDVIVEPYAVGIYNPKMNKTFYITDYKTKGEMFIAVIKYLIKKKIKLVYAHNASNFDNIILMESLRTEGITIEGGREGNQIVKLAIIYKRHKIIIKDSYKILPSSLKELSIAYGESKGIFPHSFIKKDLVNYEGPKPGIEYYEGITQTKYEQIAEKIKIKEEAEKYVMQDCKILYNIIEQYRTTIYEKFKIDIIRRDTIAGVAYKIWTTTMKNHEEIIRISTTSEMGRDIRQAYYGGISEVNIPSLGIDITNKQSDKVVGYYYDVNSLYPFIMREKLLPIGAPMRIYEDKLEEIFGYCKAEIEAPELAVLLLPIKINGTIKVPTGTWTGWYFSEELKYAKQLGYKIKILEAYNFEKKRIIFKEYIDELYKMKSETTNKSTRIITKLLLNSLYGIMGYKGKKTLPIKLETNQISTTFDPEKENYLELSTNIAIAAAITSYARIYMYKYRKIAYYSDTDSIIVKDKLPETDVSNTEIGKFKLELEILNSVHITNKTYGIKGSNNQMRIVTAGIPKGLVNYDELYEIWIKNKEIYKTYNGYKTMIDSNTIKLITKSRKKKISKNYETRIKIYMEHENKKLWVGTMPWRVENNKLMKPELDMKKITYDKEIVKEGTTLYINLQKNEKKQRRRRGRREGDSRFNHKAKE